MDYTERPARKGYLLQAGGIQKGRDFTSCSGESLH